jgi:hypothetical protein
MGSPMPDDVIKPENHEQSDGEPAPRVQGVGARNAGKPLRRVTSEPLLCDWIATAGAGESIVYHEGLLMVDRSSACSRLPKAEQARVHAVARRAWIASELGLVHLFSKRLGEGHYLYIAVRARTSITTKEIRAAMGSREADTGDFH